MNYKYKTETFWFVGKKGGLAAGRVTFYPNTIQASAEADKATPTQFEQALNKEYGGKFTVRRSRDGHLYGSKSL